MYRDAARIILLYIAYLKLCCMDTQLLFVVIDWRLNRFVVNGAISKD